jgi:hypothetical protein
VGLSTEKTSLTALVQSRFEVFAPQQLPHGANTPQYDICVYYAEYKPLEYQYCVRHCLRHTQNIHFEC